MKHNLHLSLDAAVFKQYERIVGKGNVTRAVEDHMRSYANASKGDYDVAVLKVEIDALQEKQRKVSTELQQKVELMEHLTEVAKQKELKELQAEQEAYESAAKCQVCGTMESPKWHNFAIGKICNYCFMNSDAKQVAYWSKEGDKDVTTTKL